MKRLRTSAPLCLALLGWTAIPAHGQLLGFRSVLDGSQSIPPNNSTATGTGWGVMDRQANTFTFDLDFSGYTGPQFASHIHGYVPPGSSGPVKFANPNNVKTGGVWQYDPNDEEEILAGLAYFNVHSSGWIHGEIRGQIYLDDSAFFLKSSLSSAQVVPPNGSLARGVAYFRVDVEANQIDYRVDISDLEGPETEARIHGFAGPGSNAPAILTLPLGNNKTGVWSYAEADEAAIVGGLAYLEIASSAHAAGEIRGQIETGARNPSSYCTAKQNSCGGFPSIASLGLPSASATTGFRVGCFSTRAAKPGLLLYSNAGPAALPFQGGTLCVGPSVLKRTPPSVDGNGTPGQCNGVLSIDMNEFASGNAGGNPAQFLLVPGTPVQLQWWGRDTLANGSLLSNALAYVVRP